MAGTITSANSILTLAIASLFPTPQQIQGFATDDAFDTQPLKSNEVMMGVDGKLSGGFVFVQVEMGIAIQADSDSIFIFDQWWSQMQQQKEAFTAEGVIILPSLQKKYTMHKGFLTTYPPVPDAKRVLQARKFAVTWESIIPSPL